VLLRVPTELPDVHDSGLAFAFHRRLPGYRETPLIDEPLLAKLLGVAKLYVKNETSRFGLPAFKILGASWAAYVALSSRLGAISDGRITEERLRDWASPLRSFTLIAATDGNHGRAVARVARWFGLRSRIFVPMFVSPDRRRAIEEEGAELVVIDGSFDACVDAAEEWARLPDTLLISDTARRATDVVPRNVAAGYTTIFSEIDEQLSWLNDRIDVVAVQAGVGGLAYAATHWARLMRSGRPANVVVVEPESAACVMAALAAGEPVSISARELSIMSVLQCGTVSHSVFASLLNGVSCCIAIEDDWAITATERLQSLGLKVSPSGAAGLGGLLAARCGTFAGPIWRHLGLSADSRVLVVITEA
jgi:diaminopropionate ammonia-lyase